MAWIKTPEGQRKVNGNMLVVAGATGRVEFRSERPTWVPIKGKPVELESGLWAVTVTPTGPVAFAPDGLPWMLRDGEFVEAAPKPEGFTPRERTTAGWDPTRQATVLMSGRPAKGKAKLKDAWAFDGKTMTKLAIKPAVQIVDGEAAFSPALGALVVAGGSVHWKSDPSPTYELRGDATSTFGPAPKWKWRSIYLATDPTSGLVVATANIQVFGADGNAAVYLGNGKWRALPTAPAFTSAVWFDPTTRSLRATVRTGATWSKSWSEHTCAIGDLLDAS